MLAIVDLQVTFGNSVDLYLADNYQNILLTQNMTAIFGSDPAFQVRPDQHCPGHHP
jgi:hypothetical protein